MCPDQPKKPEQKKPDRRDVADLAERVAQLEVARFLGEPYDPEELRALVRRLNEKRAHE